MQTLSNNIELIVKYATEAWDAVYKEDSRAAMLADLTGSKVKFSIENARTVKVAKVSFGGLNDYRRNNVQTGGGEGLAYDPNKRGYQEAASQLVWEERQIRMDRAAKYVIEKMDDEETNGLAVGSATTEVNRTQVVPEIDAYCFSEIAGQVKSYNKGNYVDLTGNSAGISAFQAAPLAGMNAAFKWLADHEVSDENIIAFVSTDYFNALRSTPELYRRLDVGGEIDHKVSFKIVSYEGVNLVVVPPRRFQTNFATLPQGGYTFGSGTAPIDFIVMDKGAAVHVVKYQKTKILDGEAALANTDLDSVVLFVRIYHDLFIFDNKVDGIYVHCGGFTAPAVASYDFGLRIGGKGIGSTAIAIGPEIILTDIVEQPAGDLIRVYATTRVSVPSVGAAWTTDATYDKGILAPFDFKPLLTETTPGTIDPIVLVGVRGGQVIAVKDLTFTVSSGTYSAKIEAHS